MVNKKNRAVIWQDRAPLLRLKLTGIFAIIAGNCCPCCDGVSAAVKLA
jgi:hypothetical protein